MNQKPYFVSAMPYLSMVQTFTPTGPSFFTVQVGDPNPNDVLSGEWVVNYPDFINPVTTKTIPSTTKSRNTDLTMQFSLTTHCTDFPPAPANSLAFIVSDRGFLDQAEAAALDPAHQFNFDDEPKPQRILTMIGWPIIGCQ